MHNDKSVDYYEVLQISPNAEPETIQRVYRLLARRYHPDNQETGNAQRFRLIHDAYTVVSDPATRAAYDATYQRQNEERWRLLSAGPPTETDFSRDQAIRLAVMEVLFTRRRMEPNNPGLFPGELEKILGTPQEHLEFTLWYLIQKKLVQRADNSRLVITVEGIDYLEHTVQSTIQFPRRLRAAAGAER
jgi:curved DNA-binding protein CbpA